MKIAFCGTVSVGKTTLVNELSKLPQFKDYKIFTERSKYLKDLGIPLNNVSTLKGQTIFLAERCTELMNEKMISDRSIIDVIAFTMASKEINYIHKEEFKKYAVNLVGEYDYIFYISPSGIPIEDNGVRTTDPEYRRIIDQNIKEILHLYPHRLNKLYTLTEGSVEEKIKQVLEILKN